MKYFFIGDPVNMSESSTSDISSKGPNATTPMDRVKKLLSPASKRRQLGRNVNKTFGVPLEDLVKKAPPGYKVPAIVKKICDYIEKYGIDQEGVFRINGNAKIVEQLKYSFDQLGDADIDEDSDVMAVAGLLKLFLRELPNSVVPESMTQQFVAIQQGNSNDVESVVALLRPVIHKLPKDNYNLLKYLLQFLVVLAYHQDQNKMSPMALSIVFGPNLFKCGDGIAGLRDQGTTNQIVYKFITEYDSLFKEEHEDSPVVAWEKRNKKVPPPRPPPPKVQVNVEDSLNEIPSPRQSNMQNYNRSNYQECDDWDHSEGSQNNTPRSRVSIPSHSSPCVTEDGDYLDRASPFILDSEGHSIVESPVVTARTSELVEKTISLTINEHIFGDDNKEKATVPSTDLLTNDVSDRSEEDMAPVKDRIQKFVVQGKTYEEVDSSKPTKQRLSSAAFEFFEKKGTVCLEGPTDQNREGSKLKIKDKDQRDSESAANSEFGEVERKTEVLSTFKKDAGPKRRSPSRTFRKSSSDGSDMEAEIGELLAETAIVVSNGKFQNQSSRHHNKSLQRSASVDSEDFNHNQPKSRIAFLDIHQENQLKVGENISPDRSPTNSRKPFVPPLDLSILHEHVDSSAPILARKSQSVSYHMLRKQLPSDHEEDEENENAVILSPRSSRLKKKNGMSINTDIPPSPPVEQEQYKKHGSVPSDDECLQKLRQLTKKIQNLKKKIKAFEEGFERDHGFRPSQTDKAAHPDIKKYMLELSKARKDLRRLKEEAEMGSRSRHGSGASSSGERSDPSPHMLPTIEATLDSILKNLREKRREARRPQEMSMMTRDQILEEKLCVQKALLHFESIHGRPKMKNEKDVMRPLYDRYRSIKRLLAKPTSPRDTLELETVPEDLPFEITAGNPVGSMFRNSVRIPTAETEEDELREIETMEFAVTRDFSILKDTVRPITYENKGNISPKVKKKDVLTEDWQTSEANVHDMSIPELHDELHRSKNEKKRLRKVLRAFEEDFVLQNTRKVQKEDRLPMQAEYNQYKQIKAKLRLLEALLSKHHHGSDHV